MSSEPETRAADSAAEPDKPETPEKPEKKLPAWRVKLKALIAEYGWMAIATWFTIFGLTWLGFIGAISLGFDVDTGGETGGIVLVAYAATQLTKPIRLGATVLLTPVVAKAWRRFFPKSEEDEEEDDEEDDEDEDEEDDEEDDEASKSKDAKSG